MDKLGLKFKKYCALLGGVLFFMMFHFSTDIFAQLGPGGVSREAAGNSNCKMWLDAGELSIADGGSVDSWPDISSSVNSNTPTQPDLTERPIYRNSVGEGINGQPVLRFLPSRFLLLQSSADINTSGPYTARTTFLAFRTGTDVTHGKCCGSKEGLRGD